MKTTVEIPDSLFRAVKAEAAARGLSLKTFLTEALSEKLSRRSPATSGGWPVPPPKLPKGEMQRIQSVIDQEFSTIETEDWK